VIIDTGKGGRDPNTGKQVADPRIRDGNPTLGPTDTATGAKPELAMRGARRKTAITASNRDGGSAGASSKKAARVLLGRVASVVVRWLLTGAG
jgi:hypothetical protein